MVNLKGRVALVTGAAKGLGAAIATKLALQGADVAFTYLSDTQAARDLQMKLRKMGRRCFAWRASAGDHRRAQTVVTEVCRKFGGLDILVCSAGIATSAPLVKMSESDWDKAVEVSLKGSFNYIHAVGPIFEQQNSGKIVCVGSINGLRGRMGTASYNTAKAGLVGLVKTAASELGRYSVNVNLIAPGFIETSTQMNTPELIRDLVLKECAIKRLARPEDISPLVAFLVSDDARHITGQTIKIDAGQYL